MLLTMLRAKIHRATITGVALHYTGSLGVDAELLKAAGILPNEKVQVVNVSNGVRFETYIIEAPPGSGAVVLNGAAARLGMPGDLVIIMAYAQMEEAEAQKHLPVVVSVDRQNRLL